MRRIKLDRIDRRILRNLLADGRMTNVELARRVGISAPPCLRRVRALEEAGIIRGYHAELACEALGYAVTIFAQVGLASQAETDLRAFEELIASWPEVREAYMLAGETDFLLKIIAPDWDSYQRFLSVKLTSAPNVSHVKSALMLRLCKKDPGVPISEQPPREEDAAYAFSSINSAEATLTHPALQAGSPLSRTARERPERSEAGEAATPKVSRTRR
jgi:DNA-binding Lrp family transcriptional regulator